MIKPNLYNMVVSQLPNACCDESRLVLYECWPISD